MEEQKEIKTLKTIIYKMAKNIELIDEEREIIDKIIEEKDYHPL